jgi:hypothetical protein
MPQEEQPSVVIVLPSSQASPNSFFPFPQTTGAQDEAWAEEE